MASYIVVKGLRPYDGRYELDWNFTTRQYGWIKRYSDNTADEMISKIEGGKADAELITVWGLIALHQNGKVEDRDVPEVWERLLDAPFGTAITLDPEGDAEEGDEEGPPQPSSGLSADTSGPGSSKSSETSENNQNGSGTPELATSEYEHLRSVS